RTLVDGVLRRALRIAKPPHALLSIAWDERALDRSRRTPLRACGDGLSGRGFADTDLHPSILLPHPVGGKELRPLASSTQSPRYRALAHVASAADTIPNDALRRARLMGCGASRTHGRFNP